MGNLNIQTDGIYILLGTNLGERKNNLQDAISKLNEVDEIFVTNRSKIYESSPWGITNQPRYLNQVLEVATSLEPYQLLIKLLSVEHKMGRTRNGIKWGPRIIDIDLLFYNQSCVERTGLVVPHPQLHNRRFTLIPLDEIAPLFYHPLLKKTTHQLLEECQDPLVVVGV